MDRTTTGTLLLFVAGTSAWAGDGVPDLGHFTYAQREQATAEMEWAVDAADARIAQLRQRFGAQAAPPGGHPGQRALKAIESERLQTGEWLRESRHPPPDRWDQFKSGMEESCGRLFRLLAAAEEYASGADRPGKP